MACAKKMLHPARKAAAAEWGKFAMSESSHHSRFRNIRFFDEANSDAVLRGLIQSRSLTEKNFLAIIDIVLDTTAPIRVTAKDINNRSVSSGASGSFRRAGRTGLCRETSGSLMFNRTPWELETAYLISRNLLGICCILLESPRGCGSWPTTS